jgi:hypothetical protein
VTYIRHSMRHVQQTMVDRITQRLIDLDWQTPGDVPFGEDPVVVSTEPLHPENREPVRGNMVIVSFGDSPDDEGEELGGGLMLTETVIFIDCIGTSDAVSLALAEDIKDWMTGRAPGTSRYCYLNDYTTSQSGVQDTTWQLELTGVIRERPLNPWQSHWQILKGTVEIRFMGDDT